MGKTIVMSLKELNIKGDVLDVGGDDFGVIYNVFREVEDEISLDYADFNDKNRLISNKFDATTFFFVLNDIWPNARREELIGEVISYIKDNGEIYIWDCIKNKGSIINNDIKVLLPNDRLKDFSLKKLNPFTTCTMEEVEKVLEKYCEVVETKQWEEIFYLKAIKKQRTL
ncbi:MAG: hypothetical protein ACRC2K_04055 [Clostridium sp.]